MAKKKYDEDEFVFENESEIIGQIAELAAKLGWGIAILEDDEQDVDHLIIGTIGALSEIDKTFDAYDIMMPPEEENSKTVH